MLAGYSSRLTALAHRSRERLLWRQQNGQDDTDDLEGAGGRVESGPLEAEFAAAMQDIYRRAKVESGYNATVFLQMLQSRGALETARYLIHTAKPSDGFTALWAKGRLDLTVEAHVLQPRFEPLFTDEERAICRHRLENR